MLIFEKGPLAGLVRLEFGAMDAWFEEEAEVYVHPKDPFKRIEVLPSRREVRVRVDGKVVAESVGMTVLLETGLPARYYLPKTAVSGCGLDVVLLWEFAGEGLGGWGLMWGRVMLLRLMGVRCCR